MLTKIPELIISTTHNYLVQGSSRMHPEVHAATRINATRSHESSIIVHLTWDRTSCSLKTPAIRVHVVSIDSSNQRQ